ncbi:hypothetical protein MGYG_06776 [Nannizzia gypsea CBS 118893]|uniref:Uncharacterized protein n=1 Tax=Arthroderma gypseum (strain ATCC MYA-4604 / CBS 118893) TaxID=535722 RepID=E4V161_ARTGP|nr:hypothetical protein MGYG_06776 [Nannizzia gypsea CBS 118893]EFR03776.1 hypothetical protein MGYG_06776 [Nannizzia gypsea CBS 118893]
MSGHRPLAAPTLDSELLGDETTPGGAAANVISQGVVRQHRVDNAQYNRRHLTGSSCKKRWWSIDTTRKRASTSLKLAQLSLLHPKRANNSKTFHCIQHTTITAPRLSLPYTTFKH